jgi:invasion protein IalB
MTETNTDNKAASLPGGADQLREVHGDWVVLGVATSNDGQTEKACVMVQEQTHNETRQRVLRIELRPDGDKIKGLLVLPFGLLLEKGVTMQVNDGRKSPVMAFRTALPIGCIVELDISAALVSNLKAGKTLYFHAIAADNGKTVTFAVSLNGFVSALARAEAVIG